MARHSLFPNSITIHYTSNSHDHLMVLPVGVVAGTAPGWTLPTRDLATIDWRTAVDAFAVLLADLLSTSDSIDYAELFTYEATGSPAEFLAAHTIDQAGTNVGSAVAWSQLVMPFKAVGGLSLRLTLMESVLVVDLHEPYSAMVPQAQDIADFILSDDDWIKTRGDAFPSVSLGYSTKINDKLRKRFLLNV